MSEPIISALPNEMARHQEAVVAALEEAKGKGMIDVLIVGTMPAGRYYTYFTPSMDRFLQLGCIEVAKAHILENMLSRSEVP